MLEWIVDRVRGRGAAIESPLGWMPRYENLRWDGLEDFPWETFDALQLVDTDQWKTEILSHQMLFEQLYDRLPKEFVLMRELILSSLWRSPKHWHLAHEEEDE